MRHNYLKISLSLPLKRIALCTLKTLATFGIGTALVRSTVFDVILTRTKNKPFLNLACS